MNRRHGNRQRSRFAWQETLRRALSPRTWLRRHAQVSLESLGRLSHNLVASLMTAAVIGIALALPAGLYVLLDNLHRLSGSWDGQAGLSVFLRQEISEPAAQQLAGTLQDWPEVATATLVTEVLFSTVIGRFADSMGRKKAFYILIPLFSAANIALILAPTPLWLLFAGFLMGFRMIATFSYGSMTPELVPPECLGRWRGLIGLFTGLASIPAPVIGGLIWERLGPEWVFIAITVIDLLVRTPLLYSVPETLGNQSK